MNEFIAGAISGFGQTLLGHPLDTIKVRYQNGVSLKGLKPMHYYRGITYPLISSSIINSIIFGVYHNTIDKTNNKIVSGALSGAAAAPLVYLFDVYKTKRQMGYNVNIKTFLNSRGFPVAFSRETVAFSSYFISYDYFKEQGLGIGLSGSLAGALNWTLTYPLDVIRNRQMSNDINYIEAYRQGNLWKGFNVCLARALLVNSVGFYLYEKVYNTLRD